MPEPVEPYLTEKRAPPLLESCWVGVHPYSLGRNTYISEFTHISQGCTIGSFTSIGNLCTVGAQNHPFTGLTSFPFNEIMKGKEGRETIVGSDVWIGCNSVVMEGVVVGHGAVIGAGAVVTKNVPPYAIVVGNPAKVLRYRFPPELVADLLDTEWWSLPADVIRGLPLLDPVACVEKIRGLDNKKPVV